MKGGVSSLFSSSPFMQVHPYMEVSYYKGKSSISQYAHTHTHTQHRHVIMQFSYTEFNLLADARARHDATNYDEDDYCAGQLAKRIILRVAKDDETDVSMWRMQLLTNGLLLYQCNGDCEYLVRFPDGRCVCLKTTEIKTSVPLEEEESFEGYMMWHQMLPIHESMHIVCIGYGADDS